MPSLITKSIFTYVAKASIALPYPLNMADNQKSHPELTTLVE